MTRFEGKLKSWNSEKGYGFIQPTRGGPDIFIHISSFPNDGIPPKVSERISYEIIQGKDGKPKAHYLNRLDTPILKAKISVNPLPTRHRPQPQKASFRQYSIRLIIALTLCAIVFFTVHRLQQDTVTNPPVTASTSQAQPADQPSPKTASIIDGSQFSCDGRIHCSQMRSAAEAKFFIAHCPNTHMDGDHDGIPCEQQFSQ